MAEACVAQLSPLTHSSEHIPFFGARLCDLFLLNFFPFPLVMVSWVCCFQKPIFLLFYSSLLDFARVMFPARSCICLLGLCLVAVLGGHGILRSGIASESGSWGSCLSLCLLVYHGGRSCKHPARNRSQSLMGGVHWNCEPDKSFLP